MQVLEALNGASVRRVRDLTQATGIPAATVVRILETLCRLGYARRLSRQGGYAVAGGVAALSAGYDGLTPILAPLIEAADALTRETGWPAAICTCDGTAMVVRHSTIPISPMSHKAATVNHRLDLLTRAHGRAWLAALPEVERQAVLRTLVASGAAEGPVSVLDARLGPILDAVRRSGIARRDTDVEPETTTHAVAVLHDGRPVATFGVTTFSRAVPDPAPLRARLLDSIRGIHD